MTKVKLNSRVAYLGRLGVIIKRVGRDVALVKWDDAERSSGVMIQHLQLVSEVQNNG